MGDQLENFIRQNSGQFEESPQMNTEMRWQSIEAKLQKQPGQFGWMWKAASVVFLLTTGWLLFERYQPSEATMVGAEYEEFLQAEAYYTSLIEVKRMEIEQHPSDDLKKDFQQEIDQLDNMYDELKGTFNKSANDQQLIDAMIVNLQLRIDILNQQLKILQSLNKVENETIQNI